MECVSAQKKFKGFGLSYDKFKFDTLKYMGYTDMKSGLM